MEDVDLVFLGCVGRCLENAPDVVYAGRRDAEHCYGDAFSLVGVPVCFYLVHCDQLNM
jgi:hypothetical protein